MPSSRATTSASVAAAAAAARDAAAEAEDAASMLARVRRATARAADARTQRAAQLLAQEQALQAACVDAAASGVPFESPFPSLVAVSAALDPDAGVREAAAAFTSAPAAPPGVLPPGDPRTRYVPALRSPPRHAVHPHPWDLSPPDPKVMARVPAGPEWVPRAKLPPGPPIPWEPAGLCLAAIDAPFPPPADERHAVGTWRGHSHLDTAALTARGNISMRFTARRDGGSGGTEALVGGADGAAAESNHAEAGDGVGVGDDSSSGMEAAGGAPPVVTLRLDGLRPRTADAGRSRPSTAPVGGGLDRAWAQSGGGDDSGGGGFSSSRGPPPPALPAWTSGSLLRFPHEPIQSHVVPPSDFVKTKRPVAQALLGTLTRPQALAPRHPAYLLDAVVHHPAAFKKPQPNPYSHQGGAFTERVALAAPTMNDRMRASIANVPDRSLPGADPRHRGAPAFITAPRVPPDGLFSRIAANDTYLVERDAEDATIAEARFWAAAEASMRPYTRGESGLMPTPTGGGTLGLSSHRHSDAARAESSYLTLTSKAPLPTRTASANAFSTTTARQRRSLAAAAAAPMWGTATGPLGITHPATSSTHIPPDDHLPLRGGSDRPTARTFAASAAGLGVSSVLGAPRGAHVLGPGRDGDEFAATKLLMAHPTRRFHSLRSSLVFGNARDAVAYEAARESLSPRFALGAKATAEAERAVAAKLDARENAMEDHRIAVATAEGRVSRGVPRVSSGMGATLVQRTRAATHVATLSHAIDTFGDSMRDPLGDEY